MFIVRGDGVRQRELDEKPAPATFAAMSLHHAAVPVPRATRWLAASLAVVVWALGVFAVSPELHAALHHDSDAQAHECAVTLFAHGVESLGSAPVLQSVSDARVLGCVARPSSHDWSAPDYRLRPACGPPPC